MEAQLVLNCFGANYTLYNNMKIEKTINQWDTMYPAGAFLVDQSSPLTLPEFCKYASVYGYCFGNTTLEIDGKQHSLEKGQYFGLFVSQYCKVVTEDKCFVAVRLGYKAQNQIGWIEGKGRLTYIDGCSDSLLVYPARLGDSSLNLLYFPANINQSFHTHPSIRLGCVASGAGFSDAGDEGNVVENTLSEGVVFCLEEQERHRFRTSESPMTVIAFHPDGDWGPTDHNHTMLNRTYIQK